MKNLSKLSLISLMGLTMSAWAFELHGVGNELVADGGTSRQFIPIMQAGSPLSIQSSPTAVDCQSPLRPTGLVNVGTVSDGQENLAVFAGSSDIVFTLHHQANGRDWQGVTGAGAIDCVAGEPISFKATFYRQTSSETPAGLTRTLSRSFSFKDSQSTFPIRLNATLNFATPPKTYSCKLISAPQQTIRLDSISTQMLDRQTTIKNGNQATFTLNCDDAKTTVLAMVYDNLDASNFGADKTTLTLKSGGATGVGVRLYKDGQALPLGQKSIAYEPNNPTYWQIQGGEQRQLTLGAGYVKTGEIGAGKVEAQAGFVFFYP